MSIEELKNVAISYAYKEAIELRNILQYNPIYLEHLIRLCNTSIIASKQKGSLYGVLFNGKYPNNPDAERLKEKIGAMYFYKLLEHRKPEITDAIEIELLEGNMTNYLLQTSSHTTCLERCLTSMYKQVEDIEQVRKYLTNNTLTIPKLSLVLIGE